jgi:cytidyltransferase-like protein
MKNIAIVSGFFDPLHDGHIEYMRLAREKADALYVILNNKYQTFLKRNGSLPFQEEECRLAIIGAIRYVDKVVLSTDRDITVCETLETLLQQIQAEGNTAFFGNGGDRGNHNTPEKIICDKYGIELITGLGEKIRASSEYLKRVRE